MLLQMTVFDEIIKYYIIGSSLDEQFDKITIYGYSCKSTST